MIFFQMLFAIISQKLPCLNKKNVLKREKENLQLFSQFYIWILFLFYYRWTRIWQKNRCIFPVTFFTPFIHTTHAHKCMHTHIHHYHNHKYTHIQIQIPFIHSLIKSSFPLYCMNKNVHIFSNDINICCSIKF